MPLRVKDPTLPAYQVVCSAQSDANTVRVENGSLATITYEPFPILRVAILNLMPNKSETETQLFRLLNQSILTVDVTLLRVATHKSKTTEDSHLSKYYVTFSEVRNEKFDGLIVTGAPVENLPFEEVDYWPELTEIFAWAENSVAHTFFICWAAQAHLYYRYHIPKQKLPTKLSGVFLHTVLQPASVLLSGFDSEFYVPHSRHTTVRLEDLKLAPDVEPLLASHDAGWYVAASRDLRRVYVTGHSEYDPLTLKKEYLRDTSSGNAELAASVRVPCNYFPSDDATQVPAVRWRAHGALLFGNWLHSLVYPAALKRMVTPEVPCGSSPLKSKICVRALGLRARL